MKNILFLLLLLYQISCLSAQIKRKAPPPPPSPPQTSMTVEEQNKIDHYIIRIEDNLLNNKMLLDSLKKMVLDEIAFRDYRSEAARLISVMDCYEGNMFLLKNINLKLKKHPLIPITEDNGEDYPCYYHLSRRVKEQNTFNLFNVLQETDLISSCKCPEEKLHYLRILFRSAHRYMDIDDLLQRLRRRAIKPCKQENIDKIIELRKQYGDQ